MSYAKTLPGIFPQHIRVDIPNSVMLLVAIGIVDFAWTGQSAMQFTGQTRAFLYMIPLLFIGWAYVLRSPPITQTACYVMLWCTFTQLGCVLTYLGASVGMPLADAQFANFDAALGFDWIAWTDMIHSHPITNIILTLAYDSLLPQIFGLVVLIAFVGAKERNEEMLLIAMISLIAVTAIAALLPALGPWSHYGHGAQDAGQTAYIADVLAARSGLPVTFGGRMQGIITFPSYHTVLAILFIYASRGLRWITLSVTGLNLLMLLSVPSEGGHYLSDMLGGAAVAIATIVLVSKFAPRKAIPSVI